MKIDIFEKLVFDKWQMKWLQTRKRKLQEEIQKSLAEAKVIKELWESRSQLLYWQDVLNIPQNYQKNVLVSDETRNRGIFRTQSRI